MQDTLIHAIDSKLIIDDLEHREIYNKMMQLTNAESTWSRIDNYELFMQIKIILDLNGQLSYYVDQISGSFGNDSNDNDNNNSKERFTIILQDKQLVAIKGSIETLKKIIDKLSKPMQDVFSIKTKMIEPNHYVEPYALIYDANKSLYMAKHINEWVLKGCPTANTDISYSTHIYKKMTNYMYRSMLFHVMK